jgi:outer membrane lipoprotein-sorting protein
MKRVAVGALAFLSLFISSCAEALIFGAGAVAGGVAGYYAGKEGYKVKIEKEEE